MMYREQTMTEIEEREALAHLMIAVRRFLSEVDGEETSPPQSASFDNLVDSVNQVNQHIICELKRLDEHH